MPAALAWPVLLGFHWYMDTYAGWGISKNAAASFETGSWLAIWWRINPSLAKKALMLFAPFGFAWAIRDRAGIAMRPGRSSNLRPARFCPCSPSSTCRRLNARWAMRSLSSSRLAAAFLAQVPRTAAWAAAITNGLVTARMGLSSELLPSSAVTLLAGGAGRGLGVLGLRASGADVRPAPL